MRFIAGVISDGRCSLSAIIRWGCCEACQAPLADGRRWRGRLRVSTQPTGKVTQQLNKPCTEQRPWRRNELIVLQKKDNKQCCRTLFCNFCFLCLSPFALKVCPINTLRLRRKWAAAWQIHRCTSFWDEQKSCLKNCCYRLTILVLTQGFFSLKNSNLKDFSTENSRSFSSKTQENGNFRGNFEEWK